MKAINNIQALLKGLAETGLINDTLALTQHIWNYFTKDYDSNYSDNNPNVIAKTLHRMNTGSAPRIALVGMTSAGKSSLINALFGQSIAEVRRTADTTSCVIKVEFPADTTSCVIKVEFPSGLVIYDTPGLGGDEELGYENITRFFLGMVQEEEAKQFHSVPFQKTSTEIVDLSAEQLKQFPQLDAVLVVVNISRTLNKYEKKGLKSFFLELKEQYEGRIVVAGTHIDELNKLTTEETQGQIESYNKIFNNQLIPISSISGEGLADLVINLFRVMPQKVSPAKLQESLTSSRKLNRHNFSNLSLWDMIKLLFSGKLFEREVIQIHQPIGIEGLRELLPGVYKLLHGFAEIDSHELSHEEIRLTINGQATEIRSFVMNNKVEEIADKIGEIFNQVFAIKI